MLRRGYEECAASRVAMRFLLDSTIIIDHLNGIDKAEEFLHRNASESCISVITVNEVLAGSEPDAVSSHELLLDQFECLLVDILTAKASAALRRQLHGNVECAALRFWSASKVDGSFHYSIARTGQSGTRI